ncbi:hypothetical protein CspeluHIS016_0603290 [Cutaneotrichosporon spelunceum]|uniref:Uncharacterized protein n=1 Tax=Cutaneotrichosporon spelunceum TaxID=1672016 RepID=A0AAD3TYS8_9TREE|nr:hypothetical protein CspeluHIS016_0603290 [Cutaneotrichosporon spelunceum]
MTLTSTAILAAAFFAHHASAQTYCRDRYGNVVLCRPGLSLGARIAIGVCVGVGVFLLFLAIGMARRRKVKNQWAQYRPPPPVGLGGTQNVGDGTNEYGGNAYNNQGQYANNPPPPAYAAGFRSDNSDGPAPPPATYQPSPGQYNSAATGSGANASYYGTDSNTNHNYEYEQQARMDAERDKVPGYTVGEYASPTSPPPGNTASGGNFASPTGPPPGR